MRKEKARGSTQKGSGKDAGTGCIRKGVGDHRTLYLRDNRALSHVAGGGDSRLE